LKVPLVARILQSHCGSVSETKLRKKPVMQMHDHLSGRESEAGRSFSRLNTSTVPESAVGALKAAKIAGSI
jgi:hypothetical protein